MQNRPCFICKSVASDCVVVCCNRYVCPGECLNEWRSRTYPCSSCSSSSVSSPSLLSSFSRPSTSSLPHIVTPIISSPKSIHLQQSLFVLVNSHLLRHLYKPLLMQHHQPPPVKSLLETLFSFFKKVGYTSQRFWESAFLAIKVFFERNTVSISSKDLVLVGLFSLLFKVDVRYLFLFIDKSFRLQDIVDHSSRISHAKIFLNRRHLSPVRFRGYSQNNNYILHLLLDPSSPFVLPLLRRLDLVFDYSQGTFHSCCTSLMTNNTIIELSIEVKSLTSSGATSLAEVFSSNNTLKKLTLTSSSSLGNEESLILFTSISNNSVIEILNLTGIQIEDPAVLEPLLTSSSLKYICFPSRCFIDSSVCNGLKNSSLLKTVTFNDSVVSGKELAQVLHTPNSLRKLELQNCNVCLSPVFDSLQLNTSVVELVISNSSASLNNKDFESLAKMLQINTCLLSINLVGIRFKTSQLKCILKCLKYNSVLKKIRFSECDLCSLIMIFGSKNCQ
ncbi:hypothetical protein GEMRC1_001061 [Eukaryota sp. GEM-RC1]